MQGEVEWMHGQKLEEGHTHSKSTKKNDAKIQSVGNNNRCGVKRVYNRRTNEAVMISGGRQAIAARYSRLDG